MLNSVGYNETIEICNERYIQSLSFIFNFILYILQTNKMTLQELKLFALCFQFIVHITFYFNFYVLKFNFLSIP